MRKALPSERYRMALSAHDYLPDAAQERAAESLDRVWRDLQAEPKIGPLYRLRALLNAKPPLRKPVKGLYMWGGVGRGKTFLMDQFFHALPIDEKLRLHFHRFMQQVHGDLRQTKGAEDPLKIVAANIARRTHVICFDEFFVSDIGDAMILGRLFEHLFQHGVTLVATSNIPPEKLYSNGLQRARFLPAIQQIETHCEILNVDAGTDYRLRKLEAAETYHWPLDKAAAIAIEGQFAALSPDDSTRNVTIEINGRPIFARGAGEGVAWFDFTDLCGGPRSASDYIEVAREFHTVILSNVPILDGQAENEARRFVTLVDEFYDHSVKMIISAAQEIDRLYVGNRQTFEFDRTSSRIKEMQSRQYLASAHRASS